MFAKDVGFGCGVVFYAAMPVKVVLRDVQTRCGCRLEYGAVVELKARKLQHPALGQSICLQCLRECAKQGGADIACYGYRLPCACQQLPSQCSYRGFAIGARNAQHFGGIAALLLQLPQGVHKQIQLAAYPKPFLAGSVEHAVRIGRAKPWADENRAHIGREQLGRKTARYKAHLWHIVLQGCQLRRLLAAICHGKLRPATRTPARHSQPRSAQAQHQHMALRECRRACTSRVRCTAACGGQNGVCLAQTVGGCRGVLHVFNAVSMLIDQPDTAAW